MTSLSDVSYNGVMETNKDVTYQTLIFTALALICALAQGCNVNIETGDSSVNSNPPSKDTGTTGVSAPLSLVNGCDPAGVPFGGGSGHSDDPFLICSVTQLKQSLGTMEYGELRSDLDLSGEAAWVPILLQGTLNGASHVISGLTYHAGNVPAGVFEQVTGRLTDVSFRNIHVYVDQNHDAGIAVGKNTGYVENVTVTNSELSGTTAVFRVGGVVGENIGNITGCYASLITGGGMGAIAGSNTGRIQDSDGNPTAPPSVNPPYDKTARVVFGNAGTLSNCVYSGQLQNAGSAFVLNTGTLQSLNCH